MVCLLPPSGDFFQAQLYKSRKKSQAVACTTFPEGLKRLFVNNFQKKVCNNHNIFHVCACGGGGGGSDSGGMGGVGTATANEGI